MKCTKNSCLNSAEQDLITFFQELINMLNNLFPEGKYILDLMEKSQLHSYSVNVMPQPYLYSVLINLDSIKSIFSMWSSVRGGFAGQLFFGLRLLQPLGLTKHPWYPLQTSPNFGCSSQIGSLNFQVRTCCFGVEMHQMLHCFFWNR